MTFRETKYEKWIENPDECGAGFQSFENKGQITVIVQPDVWGKRHLEKANHNLDFANLVAGLHGTIIKERFAKQTFYDWATIAYYYAIYHSALALLAKAGYKSNSHMATLCGIILHYYHKNKILEKKHIEILSHIKKENIRQFIEAQSLRERASYGVSVSFEERLAIMAKNNAIEFVNKSKEIVGS